MSLLIAAVIFAAIGLPSVLGCASLDPGSDSCAVCEQHEHENEAPGSDMDHKCHCLIHGGTMILPEPASVPVPRSCSSAASIPANIQLPDRLAIDIDYPPQV